jgi:hypothetical protein
MVPVRSDAVVDTWEVAVVPLLLVAMEDEVVLLLVVAVEVGRWEVVVAVAAVGSTVLADAAEEDEEENGARASCNVVEMEEVRNSVEPYIVEVVEPVLRLLPLRRSDVGVLGVLMLLELEVGNEVVAAVAAMIVLLLVVAAGC